MSKFIGRIVFALSICVLTGAMCAPASAQAKGKKTPPPPPQQPAQPDPSTLPPGIQEMMRAQGTLPPATQPSGTPQPKSGKRAMENRDFGAPPPEVARERLDKEKDAQYSAGEAQWREDLKAARAAIEDARKQKEEAAATAAAEPPKTDGPGLEPQEHPDLVKIRELSQPKKVADEAPPPPPEPQADPVREAEERLATLERIGRQRGFKETGPLKTETAAQPAPPPIPPAGEKKPEPPRKPEKKPEPVKADPIEN